MSYKRSILKGTLILTLTGFATRFIGFFYRIFLSRTFGEEGVGLYQLIFPIYALCFSITSAGIQTALSRCIASLSSPNSDEGKKQLLTISILISLLLSCITMIFLQSNSKTIALTLLGDNRCESLLIVMSYALPFGSVHSCICGYYYGLRKTRIPALSQLIEQFIRVGSVYIIYLIGQLKSLPLSISVATIGLVFGEIASCSFCIWFIRNDLHDSITPFHLHQKSHTITYIKHLKELVFLSIPLTANRILLNVLQSVEAISIPTTLQQYGLKNVGALSTFGVLTGMALPCILFPSAITTSVSIMLLPTVAEMQAANHLTQLKKLVNRVCIACFLLGGFCSILFFVCGSFIGNLLFHSRMAGDFIVTLSFICPFLYTNSALLSILNGLGKTTLTFCINAFSLSLRILSVYLLIPYYGIIGYLWGLLGSQLFISILSIYFLKKNLVSSI
ncbi:MAG: polysaccharide biosynthesis protein [Lachnospiraceae bacterium]